MQVDHSIKVFPLDQDLERNLQQMTAEGWMMLPGVMPVAIYHVVKMQGVLPAGEGGEHAVKPTVAITIDETKVKILRDGQLIDAV
jgi:hypothetical protein